MRYLWVVLLILMGSIGHAAEMFPDGCKPMVVAKEKVILSSDRPMLVMIHNLSTLDLWVTHPISEPDASAGWSSRLQAGHWSALLVNDRDFELSCIESLPGHEQQVPCASLLAICQWPKVSSPKAETSTFWAGEDLSLPELTAHIGSRGFVLPASGQSVVD